VSDSDNRLTYGAMMTMAQTFAASGGYGMYGERRASCPRFGKNYRANPDKKAARKMRQKSKRRNMRRS
jgi:hypothetical protein